MKKVIRNSLYGIGYLLSCWSINKRLRSLEPVHKRKCQMKNTLWVLVDLWISEQQSAEFTYHHHPFDCKYDKNCDHIQCIQVILCSFIRLLKVIVWFSIKIEMDFLCVCLFLFLLAFKWNVLLFEKWHIRRGTKRSKEINRKVCTFWLCFYLCGREGWGEGMGER